MSRLDRQDTSATESLISAIQSFDVDTVERLLKSDFEIEYRNSDHHSILHTALKLIDTGTMAVARMKEEIDYETNSGNFEDSSNKHLNPFYSPDALRRIVQVLLGSGRFNVNALTNSCETALHIAVENCRCQLFRSKGYRDMVSDIIELLLNNNANINAKTSSGETPLMRASSHGCSHNVQALLNWRNKPGVGVDLNARDVNGETALIKAAQHARFGVIELLLNSGALYKCHDHRGFYALHAVIYGSATISNASSDFLALVGVLSAQETIKVLKRYAEYSKMGNAILVGLTINDDIQKTVSILVKNYQADINSKDFRGHTILDLALKSKLRINEKTIVTLKKYYDKYGATATRPEDSENTMQYYIKQYTDKLGKTPLHRFSAVLPELSLRKKIEIFDFKHLLSSSPHKDLFAPMTVAKDHRGRTALHYAVMPTGRSLSSNDIVTLINVLNLKCIINETDSYGRTPLHYAKDEIIYKSLVKQGANEHIQDIDGKAPRDLKTLRIEEHKAHYLGVEKLEDHLNQENVDAWMIWSNLEYAYRDQFSKRICEKVRQFMNTISDEIRKNDPRFECRPVLIGSAEEGTKTGLPDEFDFNFILTNIADLCEVVRSPEVPRGYVRLRRRHSNAENSTEDQHLKKNKDYNDLFNSDGYLLTTEIACRFHILFLDVLRDPEFWKSDDFFEWDQCSEVGMNYSREEGEYEDSDEFMPSAHLCTNIQLKTNRMIEDRCMFTLISLDIVPCIKLNGWWPEEALSRVNDEIKAAGCHLVFDQPQRKYPWVPFSDPFARISFAPTEARIIKESSAVARAAYMVCKQLLYYYEPKLTYVLKTCLLYCIEALKGYTNSSSAYENLNPTELRFFVEKLMLCFHEFYLQDFCPCFLMPSCHLPIEEYLKSNHDQLLSNPNFQYPVFVQKLYGKVCTAVSSLDFCHPTPDPLNEKFDREELMRKLCMGVSYKIVIYRRVQPQSSAIGQMVWSDSESGSQRKRRIQMNADKTKVKRQHCTGTK